MNRNVTIPWVCAGVLGILTLTGCPPKNKLSVQDKKPEQPAAKTDEANAAGGIQINQDWTSLPQLSDVRFDFDQAGLNQAGRAALKSNVAVIKKLPASVLVRVEGHCDDRGTVEYNIALGQRRANAIRSYYATAGIPKNRIETISFGEERPVCREESEDCWAQNRRGATKVRNKEPLTLSPENLSNATAAAASATQ